jgi:hypothetical protein
LDYGRLVLLVEEGLIRPTIDEWREILPVHYEAGLLIDLAGKKHLLKKDSSPEATNLKSNIRLSGPSFTKVGNELRRVVTTQPSREYNEALAGSLKSKHLDLYEVVKGEGSEFWVNLVIPNDEVPTTAK